MTFTELLASGGPVLVAIILISVFAVYVFFERFLKLRREQVDSSALMARVNAAVRERDLEGALAATEAQDGPVARVLSAALERLPYGRPAVEAAFEEATLLEEQNLTRGLRPLAIIAQISPMLGLLGTVTGMIISFSEIARHGSGDPALLATGIGQALVTTAAGLIVAIPVLVAHGYLTSKVEKVLNEIDRRREELMGNVVQAVASRREEGGARAAGAEGAAAEARAERGGPRVDARPLPQG
ncbi:MAG: MotA/TolQ/ExbB proton channel family protein [Deinococcales bacterium]|nr:MotA/TolQ/ExbB proton channel family protein [Deinococcales bacterium]